MVMWMKRSRRQAWWTADNDFMLEAVQVLVMTRAVRLQTKGGRRLNRACPPAPEIGEFGVDQTRNCRTRP